VKSQWEYLPVRCIVSEATDRGGDLRGLVEEKWSTKLSELGKSGWELVSENLVERGDSDHGTWMIEVSGTMKRAGQDL
jgi:hypothetical protein